MSKPETAIYFLVDRYPSDFILEGTEKSARPVRLDAPRLKRICNTSMKYEKEGNSVRPVNIRYIYGCDTIVQEEQEKRGIKPLDGNEADQIFFENGKLIVTNDGDQRALFEFLESCIDNKNAPNRDRVSYQPEFYRYYPEEEAMKGLKKRNEITAARNLVSNLYTEDIKGNVIFDESRINFLCRVLNIHSDLMANKVNALLDIAESMPKEVSIAFNEKMTSIRVMIAEAMTLKIITFKGRNAILITGGIEQNIMEFDKGTTNDDDRIRSLCYYLGGSKEGQEMLELLDGAIAAVKHQQL